MDPTALLDLVKDNVVVQWFLVVVVILTVGTNAATNLKGPFGKVARWFQSLGERRVNREIEERRKKREAMIAQATEGRAFADQEIASVREQLEQALDREDALTRVIREHMGWDHDVVQTLIQRGVRPGDIPTPPPLRIPWRAPRTDTRTMPQVNGSPHDPDEETAPAVS